MSSRHIQRVPSKVRVSEIRRAAQIRWFFGEFPVNVRAAETLPDRTDQQCDGVYGDMQMGVLMFTSSDASGSACDRFPQDKQSRSGNHYPALPCRSKQRRRAIP